MSESVFIGFEGPLYSPSFLQALKSIVNRKASQCLAQTFFICMKSLERHFAHGPIELFLSIHGHLVDEIVAIGLMGRVHHIALVLQQRQDLTYLPERVV